MIRKKALSGFTLIELILVVAMISILAAVAVPSFGGVIDDSKKKACDANKKVLQTGYDMLRLDDPSVAANDTAIVNTLLENAAIRSSVECPSGGSYYLKDGKVYCTVHDKAASSSSSSSSSSSGTDLNLYPNVDYTFHTYTWSGGFQYDLTLINRGTENVYGWIVEFDYPGTLYSSWYSDFEYLGNHRYRLTCWDYDYAIPYGGGSLTLSGNGTLYGGDTISNVVIRKTYTRIDASAKFQVTSSWGVGTSWEGFTYMVTISNNTSEKISGWALEFTYPGTLISAENAIITSLGSNRYRFVNPAGNNITIPANGSLIFSGNGSTLGKTAPSAAVLNGVSIPLS